MIKQQTTPAETRIAQPQHLATSVAPILGNQCEWDIITEKGNRLERFKGTRREAQFRSKRLHRERVEYLIGRALQATWQAIAPDVERSCKYAGVRLTNASAYESVMEHVEMYGANRNDGFKDALTADAIRSFKALSRRSQHDLARRLLGVIV